jgi:hypothetical protein
MKYIITESKLDRAIDAYLTIMFDELKEIKTQHGNIKWVNNFGNSIIYLDMLDYSLRIDEDIWDDITEFFKINNNDAATYVRKWIEEHLNPGDISEFIIGVL